MLKHKLLWLVIITIVLVGVGCRYDMQDQPRYKPYKQEDGTFFSDKRASRNLPDGTVARGMLRENKALYTGKKEVTSTAPVQTVTDPSGNTLVASFPDAIEEFPVPVTKELVDRGEQRYKVFCIVCHGPVGNGDGMIVRRGFSKPPTYNDDRLRNAPVGHFFDVMTNGWGKMNSYASQIPVADRWAIVAYIRTLQISQNPSGMKPLTTTATPKEGTATPTATPTVTATATPKPAASVKPKTGGTK
jgi:mono/diheme cytochrome c family protein